MNKNVLTRVLSIVLALVMMFSLVACAGSNSTEQTPGETDANGREHITLIMYTQATPQAGMNEMIEAVQAYIKEKLNVTLDLRLSSNYSDTMGTKIDSLEAWDICLIGSTIDLQSYARRNAFADISNYVDLLPKTTGQLIEGALDSFTINGKVYAVPILKDMFDRDGWQVNQTLLDDLGVSFPEGYGTKWDLIDFFYELKEARDEMYPDDEDIPLVKDIFYNYDQWYISERLVGGWNLPMVDVNISEEYGYEGISFNDTAFCPVYTQEFRDLMKMVYELNDAGIGAYESSSFDTNNYYLNSGKLLGTSGSGLLSVSEDVNPNFKSKYYPSSVSYAADYKYGFAINARCKYVERAVEVLELMQNDTYLATTLHFGKEGSGWTDVDNDNVIELTEKNSNPQSRWWYEWYGWTLGGVTAMKAIPGSDTDYMEQMKEMNINAEPKPNRGFKFDATNVATELGLVNNVYAEYYNELIKGQNSNVDQIVDNFIEALKDAGMDTIVAEAQRQLDEWRAANGK